MSAQQQRCQWRAAGASCRGRCRRTRRADCMRHPVAQKRRAMLRAQGDSPRQQHRSQMCSEHSSSLRVLGEHDQRCAHSLVVWRRAALHQLQQHPSPSQRVHRVRRAQHHSPLLRKASRCSQQPSPTFVRLGSGNAHQPNLLQTRMEHREQRWQSTHQHEGVRCDGTRSRRWPAKG